MAVGLAGNVNRQFLKSNRGTIALDGTFFKKSKKNPVHVALQESLKNFASIASNPGAYALINIRGKRLHAVRDPNGLKPLYYSRSKDLTAIASEMKALWRIGLKHVDRILPGQLYTVSIARLTKKRLFSLSRPIRRGMSMEYASSKLRHLLTRSTRLITNDVKRVAVAFSGGLDSSITALLAKQANLEVELISTGLVGSQELQTVEGSAHALDLPVSIQTYSADSLDEYIRRVLWLIEEPDLMKVSIAIPLHWAAKLASRQGHSVMLCGQGSDELYGGYYRYARILDNEGPRALLAELYRSVLKSPQVNYERDEKAVCPTGVELRTPFADLEVIQFSFNIPLEFKVRRGDDLTRKWVLRETARKAGLPASLVWRRKKAIQHGTGVENAIRRLAKTHQLTADAYLSKINDTLLREVSMP
jgi:asparagine synthase (glutamine-hydrolysing)